MTTKRLTPAERAVYLIGSAVLRQLDHAPSDPQTRREIAAVSRWLEYWLSHEELAVIARATGYVFSVELWEELSSIASPEAGCIAPDDDFPF